MKMESTIVNYESQEGERLRVTHFEGFKRFTELKHVLDRGGNFVDPSDPRERPFRIDEVGRNCYVSELRVYEGSELIDTLPLEAQTAEPLVQEMKEALLYLADQGVSIDELLVHTSDLFEKYGL